GRPRGRAQWLAVAVVLVVSVPPGIARTDAATVALVLIAAGGAGARWALATGFERRARAVPAVAACAFAVTLLAGVFAEPADADTVLRVYQVVLVTIVAALVVDRRRGGWSQTAVTDLVIDLGDASSGSLAAVLGQAVGDPALVVGHAAADGRYVDERGAPVTLPARGSGRFVTAVDSVVLVGDRASLRSPRVAEPVAAAVRLSFEGRRLRADVAAWVQEVEASRDRLLRAREVERRGLERRLDSGVLSRLDAAAAILAPLERDPDEGLVGLPEQLERTRSSLRQFVTELRPPELDSGGLAAALGALAAAAPLPVTVTVTCGRLAPPVELAAWFVCSEGLANVIKHSAAPSAVLTAQRAPDGLVVCVEDAGRGGADRLGRGLSGLRTRVQAAGGRFDVAARTGGGTRLRATFPIGEPA
ncbi:MAG: hypothetical protein QOF29_543, partial [bacterium]